MNLIVPFISLYILLVWCGDLFQSGQPTAEGSWKHNKDKRARIASRLARHGFGRVLTWNVQHLGGCLKEDSVEPLRETACIVLQSANIIALQNAENLDLSCLPCNTELKDDYEWPGEGSSEELKVLVKTKRSRSFSVKKISVCTEGTRGYSKRHEYSSLLMNTKNSTNKDVQLANESTETASKRDMFTIKRGESTLTKKDISYAIMTVQADLNIAQKFILANVKLPLAKSSRRDCFEGLLSDISNVKSDMRDAKVIVLGDFHIDSGEGSDVFGELTKVITNAQVDGESYRPAITYSVKDPVTTVDGRRFDNILTNGDLKGNFKVIGPELPLSPETYKLPLTLQRLYNNYMVAQYTLEGNESSNIYDCIKAYQLAGKSQLENVICRDTWVPSGFISDHLPYAFTVKIQVSGKSSPVEVKLASWNINGKNIRPRLADPAVRRVFLNYLKKHHVVVFHEFPTYSNVLEKDELESSDLIGMKQGSLETEFGIFLNVDTKDGDPDMFVLRRTDDDAEISEPTPNEAKGFLTKVGLFIAKLTVDSEKVRVCLYLLTLDSDDIDIDKAMERMIPVIQKDLVKRSECQVKLLLASLHTDPSFGLDASIYRQYKIIQTPCEMTGGQNMHRYIKKGTTELHDYVIVIDKDKNVTVENCLIDLPGAEKERGFEQITDWQELSIHYPLSVVLGRNV